MSLDEPIGSSCSALLLLVCPSENPLPGATFGTEREAKDDAPEGGGVVGAMDGCALLAAYLFPLFEVEMSMMPATVTQMKTILLC